MLLIVSERSKNICKIVKYVLITFYNNKKTRFNVKITFFITLNSLEAHKTCLIAE